MSESFQDRLRRLRGTRTKAEFSRFLKIPPPMYHRYEAGQIPKSSNLQVIASRCGVTTDFLLGGDTSADSGADTMPAAPEVRAPAVTEEHAQYLINKCRYPADCDLKNELAQMRAQLESVQKALETNTNLLSVLLRDKD